jgi:hypothetical protein
VCSSRITESGQSRAHPFRRWLFADLEVKGTEGPHTKEKKIGKRSVKRIWRLGGEFARM